MKSGGIPAALAVDDENVYRADSFGSTIHCVPRGGATATVLASEQDGLVALVVDATGRTRSDDS